MSRSGNVGKSCGKTQQQELIIQDDCGLRNLKFQLSFETFCSRLCNSSRGCYCKL